MLQNYISILVQRNEQNNMILIILAQSLKMAHQKTFGFDIIVHLHT